MHVKKTDASTTVEARRWRLLILPTFTVRRPPRRRRPQQRQWRFLLGFLSLAMIIITMSQCLLWAQHTLRDDDDDNNNNTRSSSSSSRALLSSLDISQWTTSSAKTSSFSSSSTKTFSMLHGNATTPNHHHHHYNSGTDKYTDIDYKKTDENDSVAVTTTTTTITIDEVEEEEEEETFQWDYLNLAHNVSCGQYKCYFRRRRRINNNKDDDDDDDHRPPFRNQSLSNDNNNDNDIDIDIDIDNNNNNNSNDDDDVHPTIAYLITVQDKNNNQTLWHAAWELAQTLHSNYSQTDYFLLGPPQTLAITEKWANRLNAAHLYENGINVQQKQQQQQEKKKKRKKNYRHRYRSGQIAVVQKVRPAPQPSLLYGTTRYKELYFWDHFEQDLLLHVQDFKVFERTIVRQIRKFTSLLYHNPQFQCLLLDFQVMIDSHGKFHGLDLNNCIDQNGTLRTDLKATDGKISMKRIQAFRIRMMEYLKKNKTTTEPETETETET
jgi:hypothetical protein